jgi:thiazole/oxazole-forming peptide maturase SagD family component
MRVSVRHGGPYLHDRSGLLLKRMLSPLCGLDQRISVSLRAETSPQLVSIGAELTGVHVLLGLKPPPIGSYHIGGVGLSLDDALIRTLGESAERYAQLTAEKYRTDTIRFASHDALRTAGHWAVPVQKLTIFDSTQFARGKFPYSPFRSDMPMGWVEGSSLVGGDSCWVPAQAVYVGYEARDDLGERRIVSGVTTGTAAHRTHDQALLNAIVELIQIDCAVGHWYSRWPAHPLVLDERVDIVKRVMETHGGSGASAAFSWLPSPDLPGFVIACMIRGGQERLPAAAVGLGCSLQLGEALYKAWLEAIGVANLVAINLLQAEIGQVDTPSDDGAEIYDLDSNVAWYAAGHGAERLRERFTCGEPLGTSALPEDVCMEPASSVEYLVKSLLRTGKELYRWDLTPPDISELGLVVERVWSPDMISLPLPSAPPMLHSRFVAYGGVSHEFPHPYP